LQTKYKQNDSDMTSYLHFLSRNKLYTCIEAFGMAFALGFVILLVAYAKTEFDVGKSIKNAQEIYVLGTGDMFGMTLDTPVEFFPQMPEIDTWTRIVNGEEQDVMVGDEYFNVKSVFIDSTFFQFFDFRLTGCDRHRVLTSEDEVIVAESFARKAFGTEEAVGKQLRVGDKAFTVSGVVQDFGRKDLFKPTDLFFSIKRAYNYYERMDNFGNTQTFLTLQPGADSRAVADKLLKKYIAYWPDFYAEEAGAGTMLWGTTLTPFSEVYFSSLNDFSIMTRQGDDHAPCAGRAGDGHPSALLPRGPAVHVGLFPVGLPRRPPVPSAVRGMACHNHPPPSRWADGGDRSGAPARSHVGVQSAACCARAAVPAPGRGEGYLPTEEQDGLQPGIHRRAEHH